MFIRIFKIGGWIELDWVRFQSSTRLNAHRYQSLRHPRLSNKTRRRDLFHSLAPIFHFLPNRFEFGSTPQTASHLDLQTLDLVLERPDLAHEVRRLVGGDAAGDDGTGDTAGAAQLIHVSECITPLIVREKGTYSHLAGDVDVGDVLVLAEEGQVEEDGERAGVGGQDDEF